MDGEWQLVRSTRKQKNGPQRYPRPEHQSATKHPSNNPSKPTKWLPHIYPEPECPGLVEVTERLGNIGWKTTNKAKAQIFARGRDELLLEYAWR